MTQAKPLDLLREAMAAARANDKPRTRRLLLEVTRLDARNETAWQWLAGVAADPLEACGALEKALALNPASEKTKTALRPVRLQAGIAAARAKDKPTARRLLMAAIADDPRSEPGWLWLASAAETSAESLAHLERVLAINPQNTTAQKGLAFYRARLDAEAAAAAETQVSSRMTTTTTKSPTPASGVRAPAREVPPPPRPKTVLVVDDSRTIRKLAGMTLTGAGFRVVEAEDGAEAVARIRDDGIPDLILLDVAMPGMDGYELCRLIRHNPDTRRVPVVMLTGRDGFFDKIRGKLAGTSAYLAKPLQPDVLLAAVRKHCPAAPAPIA